MHLNLVGILYFVLWLLLVTIIGKLGVYGRLNIIHNTISMCGPNPNKTIQEEKTSSRLQEKTLIDFKESIIPKM